MRNRYCFHLFTVHVELPVFGEQLNEIPLQCIADKSQAVPALLYEAPDTTRVVDLLGVESCVINDGDPATSFPLFSFPFVAQRLWCLRPVRCRFRPW